ncbi:hypothetical protein ABC345_02525 [Shouchella sp. 1P09AA]|uniref:hypothetical protein n=1 Tax=unclassified Shouchella TaxID=2893065 RepID=UPI0039A1E7C3
MSEYGAVLLITVYMCEVVETVAESASYRYTEQNIENVIPKGSSIKVAVVITGEILGTTGNEVCCLRDLCPFMVGKGLFSILCRHY